MLSSYQRWWRMLCLIVLSIALADTGHAQGPSSSTLPLPPEDHPEAYAVVQDTMYVYRAYDGDTIPRECFAPSYTFSMVYDSMGTVDYKFTDCKVNHRVLKLNHWIDRRSVNADQVLLSFNSTTDTFTCRTGDTISFFRDIRWYDSLGVTSTTNYYALDSLDFAVELVRMSDSLRGAQLDSIGFLDNRTPGIPRIHGTRSLFSGSTFVVPPELNGEQVFIRVLVYHRGDGTYWFSRTDGFTVCWSERLKDPMTQEFYRRVYEPQIAKPSLEELAGSLESSGARLDVRRLSGSPEVAIDFSSSPSGRTAVAVYNALGELLFYPYVTPESSGDQMARYRFDRSGVYFIALLHNGRLVATRKLTITL